MIKLSRILTAYPYLSKGKNFGIIETEMLQSHDALQSLKRGLEGSLESQISRANLYISKIEYLFKSFGGVK